MKTRAQLPSWSPGFENCWEYDMPLTPADREEWVRKLTAKYPHVIEKPFACRWRPTDVDADGYVPFRERGIKYYMFETREKMLRADNQMRESHE